MLRRLLTLASVFVLLATQADAIVPGGSTIVTQTANEDRASQVCAEARGTGAQTATFPAVGGQFAYVNMIEVNAFASGGAAAGLSTPASITTTNLAGASSPTLGAFAMQAQAAGAKIDTLFYPFGFPWKAAAAGTAVTFVAPSVTNVGWHILACGYYAP